MRNTSSQPSQTNSKDWGNVVPLLFFIPLVYLFLPNFLVGSFSVELKAYLLTLAISLSVSFAIYRNLHKWDTKNGLLNENVSVTQKFWSFWGIALFAGSLTLSGLIAINAIGIPETATSNNIPRPPFKDARAKEFCPLGLWGKVNTGSDIPFLCVLVLHVPNLSIFVAGDEVANGESCLYYGIQEGRLGMKFLDPALTCLEQKAIEISESVRSSATESE